MLFLHLIVRKDYSKRLRQYDVQQPEEHIVRVARDVVFKLTLRDHYRDIYHHQYECDKVNDRENSNNNVLVSDRGDCKRDQHAHFTRNFSPSTRVVDVTNQEVVNRLIPLAPVFREVVSVPPV